MRCAEAPVRSPYQQRVFELLAMPEEERPVVFVCHFSGNVVLIGTAISGTEYWLKPPDEDHGWRQVIVDGCSGQSTTDYVCSNPRHMTHDDVLFREQFLPDGCAAMRKGNPLRLATPDDFRTTNLPPIPGSNLIR